MDNALLELMKRNISDLVHDVLKDEPGLIIIKMIILFITNLRLHVSVGMSRRWIVLRLMLNVCRFTLVGSVIWRGAPFHLHVHDFCE